MHSKSLANNTKLVYIYLKFSESCTDPGNPQNGRRIALDFRHGKKVSFTCQANFKLTGTVRITCLDGTWSNKVPTCKGSIEVYDRWWIRANNRNHIDIDHFNNEITWILIGTSQVLSLLWKNTKINRLSFLLTFDSLSENQVLRFKTRVVSLFQLFARFLPSWITEWY